MQVKKFEAKTMKEALVMVKNSLGPEAIILSAKDVNSRYGLAGEKSVEITAAVSETSFRKKQLAEKKLNAQDKEKYVNSSARSQKQFIEKVFDRVQANQDRKNYQITQTPYIDILDDDLAEDSESSRAVRRDQKINFVESSGSSQQNSVNSRQIKYSDASEERVRSAAKEALKAAYFVDDEVVRPVEKKSENNEILQLKQELSQLKSVLQEFQKVPQNFLSMHPGAQSGIPYELSFMYEKLIRAGVSVDNAEEILKIAEQKLSKEQMKKRAMVDAWVVKYIMDSLVISENRTAARYHAFVGPSGQGKTSTLVKMASHLVICEKKNIAIVSIDSKKVGAAEQLKIYSQILNVPFCLVRNTEDWLKLEKFLKQYDHVLIDCPGLSLKSMSEIDFLRAMLPAQNEDISIHYVQSILAKDADALEIASRYVPLGVKDVVFTALDESNQHGLIYNFQKSTGLALHSFGIGSQIPEDFEPATRERVIDLLFKLTRFSKEKNG